MHNAVVQNDAIPSFCFNRKHEFIDDFLLNSRQFRFDHRAAHFAETFVTSWNNFKRTVFLVAIHEWTPNRNGCACVLIGKRPILVQGNFTSIFLFADEIGNDRLVIVEVIIHTFLEGLGDHVKHLLLVVGVLVDKGEIVRDFRFRLVFFVFGAQSTAAFVQGIEIKRFEHFHFF